jgi:hypothetical protein
MLTIEDILRVEKLEQTYKDSPRHLIGYLQIMPNGELKTFDPDGNEDKPIQIDGLELKSR